MWDSDTKNYSLQLISPTGIAMCIRHYTFGLSHDVVCDLTTVYSDVGDPVWAVLEA